MDDETRIDADMWTVANVYIDHFRDDGIQKTRLRSIRFFLDRLPFESVLDAMSAATDRMMYSKGRSFRYFCGICRRQIKKDTSL
ncbi:MAG: hypothetical protein GY789_18765 [Hyphomicrobiales bacterium]|nr:hypothetical protein [Hyphomicrobiales bacterium]